MHDHDPAFAAVRRLNSLARPGGACEHPCVFEDHFAGEVAASYDDTLGTMGSPEVLGPTVDLLAGLAGDGSALELAIGTGRGCGSA